MKALQLILIIFTVGIVGSCTSTSVPEEDCYIERHGESTFKNLEIGDFEILVIDSCEYLVIAEDFQKNPKGFGFMAHKGNCKNPVHWK